MSEPQPQNVDVRREFLGTIVTFWQRSQLSTQLARGALVNFIENEARSPLSKDERRDLVACIDLLIANASRMDEGDDRVTSLATDIALAANYDRVAFRRLIQPPQPMTRPTGTHVRAG